MQQCDSGRTVRIIFDRGDLGGNADFVPFEINDSVMPSASAAAIDTHVICPSALRPPVFTDFEQTFLRGRRCDFLVKSDSPEITVRQMSV